ncbi:hypothetical protein [Oceanirhabdus sp. W0125-5]|uniref:hypothetical protein n=1 Tax=Oceanirhabdus sp. W0125-5 TaxID=2999116 RepID=UPI0022F3220F|nr:hypothetical protein [Oceanirhabdus sp. W0125-5]WBW96992.1 hypothetical protein OW730_25375 [Oceanirhabdus sp. W0125-5]
MDEGARGMTLIENISEDILILVLTVFPVMYINIYLLKILWSYKAIENCTINISGMKEPHKEFSFIKGIPMMIFLIVLYDNDGFIVEYFNGYLIECKLVSYILYIVIVGVVSKIIGYIMDNKQWESGILTIKNQLIKNIILNVSFIVMITISVVYSDFLGIKKDYMIMIGLIIIQVLIIISMKPIKYYVLITEAGIYLPHMKIDWETIIGYEFEDNLLIIKRETEEGYEEYSLNVYQEDRGKIASYFTKRIA